MIDSWFHKVNLMKNFPTLFLFILMIFAGFCSCREKHVYRIGVSQCSSDDWRNKMNDEILREILLHDDVEVEIRSAEDSNEKQIEDIRYYADNGFDMIIVAPNAADALTPVIEEVYNLGIPVMIFDRNINNDSYTARIGVDNVGMGQSAAHYALHLLGDSLKVMEIYGLPGSTPADERHRGFLKELNAHGGKIVAGAPANWLMENSMEVADSMLRLHPEVNLIFAHNDRMAIGASKIAKEKGRTDIKIIGIDAAPQIGIKAVADGMIDATFLYPTEGHLIIREAIKILHGEPYDRELILPMTSAVDLSNADILLLQNETLTDDTNKIRVLKGQLDDYWAKHSAQTTVVYAIIVILILVFGVLFLVLRLYRQKRRHHEMLLQQNKLLEEERDKQKELNEKLEEATQSKLAFFTNVSHDLRTPLTLIAEPVDQLKDAPELKDSQKNLMRIAAKNVRILLRLIDQILDFRKFENNKIELRLNEVDLRLLIKEWFDSFKTVAKKRDIKLILNSPENDEFPTSLAIDVEKIERVFFNLLSNALKYSPDNSEIIVSYKVINDNIVLTVADNGLGISERDIPHIFDRFFQVDNVRPKGSGIGLSLAKAFVELHGGTISVESELQKGTVFTIKLPLRHIEETPKELNGKILSDEVKSELDEIEPDIIFEEDKPQLLVIDDNKDIRDLLSELLGEDYNVIRASGGKEGIRKASKYVPDAIVCDVMMPDMDGMEVCRRLKEETATSHIPVLLLTACSMDEQRAEGFESGADGYLAKPFSNKVLKAHIKSLISNRKRINNVMPENTLKDKGSLKPSAPSYVKKDVESDFYEKFINIFEQKMGDADLSVETLASDMGLERTQFYRKIKAITNYSPVELMRSLRLKRARKLVTSSDLSISEIAYKVGFSTPAYFTKCYRDMFGETPSETRSVLS